MPAVLVGRSIYVIGGVTAKGFSTDIERIDLDTGKVVLVPTKLTGRVFHTAKAQGPYIYVMGGVPQKGDGKMVERYDTRDGSVTTLAPLTAYRRYADSAIVGDYLYLVGGSSIEGKPLNLMSVYDIRNNRWSDGPPMPTARECAVGVCDQFLYAVGGYDAKSALTTVEAYSLLLNRWSVLPTLPTPISAEHLAVEGHTIRTFGEYATLDGIYQGDMRRRTWTLVTPPPGYVPNRHSAVVVAPDAVYVIGGNTSSGQTGFDTIQRIPRLTAP